MAKAQFHKNQRVYVKPVGTWALVERVIPQWTKGLDSPIRIFYDVGLGREFGPEELEADAGEDKAGAFSTWRIVRLRGHSDRPEDVPHHPYPGTYPAVRTGRQDWGGWRVPGSEYDLDPYTVEAQARLIAASPQLLEIAKTLCETAAAMGGKMPEPLAPIVESAEAVLTRIDAAGGPDSQVGDTSSTPPPRVAKGA